MKQHPLELHGDTHDIGTAENDVVHVDTNQLQAEQRLWRRCSQYPVSVLCIVTGGVRHTAAGTVRTRCALATHCSYSSIRGPEFTTRPPGI